MTKGQNPRVGPGCCRRVLQKHLESKKCQFLFYLRGIIERKKKLKEPIYQNYKEDNMFILAPLQLLTLLHTTFSKPVEASYR